MDLPIDRNQNSISPVAQSVEQLAVNQLVGGSSPSRGASSSTSLRTAQRRRFSEWHANPPVLVSRSFQSDYNGPFPAACLAARHSNFALLRTRFGPMSTNRFSFNCRVSRIHLSKGFSVGLVGLTAFFSCALAGVLLGIPEPNVHDEFSYLLAADTFSQGRLTNPTHPLWVHFESFHINHEPTYMSKYQPAQGLILAFGKVVGGHPIIGVWLSMALMSAAVCWMLHAWLPARWALLGGLLTIIHPYTGAASYWAQSYWGGAIPAAGGALLLGGVRRAVRTPRSIDAVLMGVGMVILANSRPYEGFVLAIPVGLALLSGLVGSRRPAAKAAIKQILLPLALVGVISTACMAYYNARITGSASRLPYLVHQEQYDMFAYFIWQKLPPEPLYRHKVIRDYHAEYELPLYREKQTLGGFFKVNYAMLMMYGLLCGNVFLIPLIGSARSLIAWCWDNRWGRLALLTYVFFALGVMLESVTSLHYWAPITALFYFFVIQGLRLWRARNHRVGQAVLCAVLLLGVMVGGINAYHSWKSRDPSTPHLQRARLLHRLNQGKDRHLIVVSYGPKHSYNREWVYNEADIDGSKVVWARAMDLKENCKLVDYFKDRVIWSLEIDQDDAPIHLKPFSKQSCL